MKNTKIQSGLKSGAIMFVATVAIWAGSFGLALADTNWANSSTNIYNTNSGNVGIGTSVPGAKLDVQGLIKIIGATNENASSHLSITSSVYTSIGKWAESAIGLYNNGSLNNLSQISVGFYGGTTNAPGALGFITTSGAGNTKGDIFFATRDVTTDTAPTERVRITSSGRMGIGSSTPSEALVVTGNIKLTGNLLSDGDICIGKCI